jgi:phenylacetate-CoA ligase
MNASVAQRLLDGLLESQSWRPAVFAAEQRRRLGAVLSFARAEVPFYRRRLEPLFRGDGSIVWDAWDELPVLTRGELARHANAMRPARLPPGHGETHDFTTSGTTGEPVTVRMSQFANVVSQCCQFRGHLWNGLDWSSDVLTWFGDNGAEAEPGVHRRGLWGPPWLNNSRGSLLSIARATPAAEVTDAARRLRVSYLMGRPRTLQELAAEVLRRGETLPLRALLTFGAETTDDARDACRAAFGAEMVGSYASKEAGLLAYDCAECGRRHISADATFVEVVDDRGRRVAPGEVGRIVVTPLFNFAQPLIRYDQGDLGVIGAGAGHTALPVLDRLVGRTTDLFRFRDGRVLAPSIPESIGEAAGAALWQVAQVDHDIVEVRYIPAAGRPFDETVFSEAIMRFLRPDLHVRFALTPDLGKDRDKFRRYRFEVPSRSH